MCKRVYRNSYETVSLRRFYYFLLSLSHCPHSRVATGAPNGKQFFAKVTGARGVTRKLVLGERKVPFKPRVEKWTELRGQGYEAYEHTVVFSFTTMPSSNGLMLA